MSSACTLGTHKEARWFGSEGRHTKPGCDSRLSVDTVRKFVVTLHGSLFSSSSSSSSSSFSGPKHDTFAVLLTLYVSIVRWVRYLSLNSGVVSALVFCCLLDQSTTAFKTGSSWSPFFFSFFFFGAKHDTFAVLLTLYVSIVRWVRSLSLNSGVVSALAFCCLLDRSTTAFKTGSSWSPFFSSSFFSAPNMTPLLCF